MNIVPVNMTVMEWAESMLLPLQKLVVAPRLLNEAAWRQWGDTLIQLPGIKEFNPPQPDKFTDWRDWAYEFNRTVAL